jgi:AcrR family transcriptional regulator
MDERERIREAVLDLVLEHGIDGTSVEMITDRAGVDGAAFEREFGSRENCFLEIYRESNERFVCEVDAAFEGGGTWPDSLRAAAYVGARFLRDRPREVRFNVLQVFRAGEMAMAERDRYHQDLVDLVDAGRQELDDPDSVPRAVAEGVVGAIVETMVKRVGEDGSAANAESAVPELMYIAVRPYLGHEAALEELSIPAPPELETDAHSNETR